MIVPCNFCQAPPADATVTVRVQNRSVTVSKWGFTPFGGDTSRRFLTLSGNGSASGSHADSGTVNADFGGCHYDWSLSQSMTAGWDVVVKWPEPATLPASPTISVDTYSGSGTWSNSYTATAWTGGTPSVCAAGGFYPETTSYTDSGSGTVTFGSTLALPGYSWSPSAPSPFVYRIGLTGFSSTVTGDGTVRTNTYTATPTGLGAHESFSNTVSETFTLSDEFTDEMLESLAAAALADASYGSWSETSLPPGSPIDPAFLIKGTNEGDAQITLASRSGNISLVGGRYEVKIAMTDVAFCRVKASWRIEFHPDDESGIEVVGSGNKTISRSTCFPYEGPFEETTEEFEAPIPDRPGIVVITGLKLEFLP